MLSENDFRMIQEALANPPVPKERVKELLCQAEELKGLSFLEAGELLNIRDDEQLESIVAAAGRVKEMIYGKRVVLFAPLYLSNECTNNCLYCGFRKENAVLSRLTLSSAEAVDQARLIASMGHKRILLVCGEKPALNGIAYVVEAIRGIYENVDIRRINVNVAPQSTEGFKLLKEAGIGTYQLFQETYHPGKYSYYHPSGAKADYRWRITAFERALEAGIDDYGMGVLFGLYDYRFEVMALIKHAQKLEQRWGVGPHTVSVPRLKKAAGATVYNTGFLLSDQQLSLVTAVLRLALPYTGLILSTREPGKLRDYLLKIGISQISAGSSAAPGGYSAKESAGTQFYLEDNRTLDEVVRDICEAGYLPSFCTACYRRERTGERFMALAKAGEIKELCQPNALLTFKEFLLDFASSQTQQVGEKTITNFVESVAAVREKTNLAKKLAAIDKGMRDVYY